jgi:hypothetical protein
MQYSTNLLTRISALLCGGLLFATGCGDVDQSGGDAPAATDTVGTEPEDLGTGSEALHGASSGQPPSCSICAITQSCCESVGAGPLCTFSADTCYSLDPLRQTYYARNCRMVLRTTISAQTMNNRTAPNACFLP